MQLNKPQMSAVSLRDGPALILAGPGSGKTAVITNRVLALIKSGVPPEDILVITFTRAAAGEMRSRFARLSNSCESPVTFGTFHSIFYGILCHEANLSSKNIIQDSNRYRILKDILLKESEKNDDEAGFITSLLDEISAVKSNGGLTKTYHSKNLSTAKFAKIYSLYAKELARLRLVDFDDMLLMTRKLFLTRRNVLNFWRARYKYIMVDEFQDVNAVSYEILKLLAAPSNNLFAVGDDDQSIYGFRGSKPEIMLRFPKDFPGAKKILLNINYRSSEEIVSSASKLISHNKNRFSKKLQAFSGAFVAPYIKCFDDVYDENKFIAEEILKLHSSGISYNEMSALYRTNRSYILLCEMLKRNNIPFVTDSKLINIYEHWISQDIFAYLRIIAGSRARNDFMNIINRPVRYVRRESFDEGMVDLNRLAKKYLNNRGTYNKIRKLEAELAYAKKLSPYAAVSYIRKGIGYDEYLRNYAENEHLDINTLFLIEDGLMEASKGFQSISEWLVWVEENKNFMPETGDRASEAVNVTTMHRSKGLEYTAVFIPDANDGITPYHKAKLEHEIEEERRLFYVAVTRAKKYLYISYAKTRYNKKMIMSRFISEMLAD